MFLYFILHLETLLNGLIIRSQSEITLCWEIANYVSI